MTFGICLDSPSTAHESASSPLIVDNGSPLLGMLTISLTERSEEFELYSVSWRNICD